MESSLTETRDRAAAGLGLFSIGLGLAEVIAPRHVNGLVGIRDPRRARITRALGARKIVTGLGVLTRRRPGPWLWARVAGDVVDLALLGAAFASTRARGGRIATAIGAVLGVGVLDVLVASRATGQVRAATGRPVRRSVTVAGAPDRVYRFWRDLRNLPTFMVRLESVEVLESGRSRWQARGPAGTRLRWDAEIVEDRANELIRWQSLDGDGDGEGTVLANRGSVRFRLAPGGRGTEIELELQYQPPGGQSGRSLAFLSDEALGRELENDLRRLKQVIETGEVVHSDASVHTGRHSARPGYF